MDDKKLVKLSNYLTPIFQTTSNEFSEWFGYYNYDALNRDQSKMLCNRSKVDGVTPAKGMTIELGYYDIPSGKWHNIGESNSWNWQQGAMLQWLPGKGNENKVIYNTSHRGRLIAILHDIGTNKDIQINWPIYGITPDGKKSITIDLERSYFCRAYHYQSVINPEKDGRVYKEDGIFEIDFETNERKRILSIQAIINADYRPYFDSCKHWLEHVMINPSGTRISFLHRFSPENNVYDYQTRLCVADIDGGSLQVVPGWEKQGVSHFGWKSDHEFVIYTVLDSSISSRATISSAPNFKKIVKRHIYHLVKSLIPSSVKTYLRANDKGYFLYRIAGGDIQLTAKWQGHNIDIDGHPSFTLDGRYMITDSYPDSKGYQRLLVFDALSGKSLVIGRLYASFKGNPASCDLHPKLCRNNDYLAIDTAYDRRHHMMIFRIDWKTISRKLSV